MTFHNFTDGDVLYAAQLNALAAALAADATQKANVARNDAAADAAAKDDVLRAQLQTYADDQDDIVRADAAADATAKDDVLRAQLQTYADDGAFWRGTIPSSGDLDTAREPGLYGYVAGSANAPGEVSGMLLVSMVGLTPLQKAWTYGPNPREFYRYAGTASSPFGPWQRVDGRDRLDALEQDTGWRNVSAELLSGASGTLHIRRAGVTVWWRSLGLTVGTAHAFYWPVVGMRAPSPQVAHPAQAPIAQHPFYIDNVGRLCRERTAAPLTVDRWFEGTYVLDPDTPWPTTLPGTPA